MSQLALKNCKEKNLDENSRKTRRARSWHPLEIMPNQAENMSQ